MNWRAYPPVSEDNSILRTFEGHTGKWEDLEDKVVNSPLLKSDF
jgi:hypothetical protein